MGINPFEMIGEDAEGRKVVEYCPGKKKSGVLKTGIVIQNGRPPFTKFFEKKRKS